MKDEIPPTDFLPLAHGTGVVGYGHFFDLIAPPADLGRHLRAELKSAASQPQFFQVFGLENLIDEIDRSSNRISLGLVISALIIGSSLIIMTGRGPMFMGFPLLGFIGFSLAGFLGFFLAIVIIRSKKF